MSVTQKDIAEKLNVSIMTVSKALQGHPDISAKTRKRVEKTAREMNYTVNVVARSLVQKRTNTIGVVVPDISEPFYAEIVRGIETVARPQQYNILLADSDNDPELEVKAIRTLVEKRVDGFIVGPTEKSSQYISILKQLSIPYVLINSNPQELECDSITVDRAHGARQAMTHLLKGGYEEIYFLYTYEHMAQSQHSIRGCYEAFDSFGKSNAKLNLIHCVTRELETFYTMTKQSIHYAGRKIGLFVWDDEMAIAVYRAIAEKGYAIPDQIGLIGFDDIKISKYLPKSLTTVFYPKFKMGQKGAERLFRQLASVRKLKVKNIELALKLVKRETTL